MLSMVSNHLFDLGPRFFSCSTETSPLPAALLFIYTATHFLSMIDRPLAHTRHASRCKATLSLLPIYDTMHALVAVNL